MEWLNKPETIKPETTCLIRVCSTRDDGACPRHSCGIQACLTKACYMNFSN